MPLDHGGKPKFLPDDTAEPTMLQGQPAPLALRFFAIAPPRPFGLVLPD